MDHPFDRPWAAWLHSTRSRWYLSLALGPIRTTPRAPTPDDSMARSTTPFGTELRRWRARAGLSQLDLATAAGTTPRHVSFVETGRSRPGPDFVHRVADALDVPLRERNGLFTAAGLAAPYAARGLDDEEMRAVRGVVDRLFASHEPFPAWLGGSGFRFIAANRAAERLFPGMCAMSPTELVDLWFGPGPLRSVVENWADVARAGVAALRREARASSDPRLTELAERAEAHARALPPKTTQAHPELPVICPILVLGGRRVRTISTVLRFDSAVDLTAADLRVELMFPADAESAAFFADLSR